MYKIELANLTVSGIILFSYTNAIQMRFREQLYSFSASWYEDTDHDVADLFRKPTPNCKNS